MISNRCLRCDFNPHSSFNDNIKSLSLFSHVEDDCIFRYLLKFDVHHCSQNGFLSAFFKLIYEKFVPNQELKEVLSILRSSIGEWNLQRFRNSFFQFSLMRCVFSWIYETFQKIT